MPEGYVWYRDRYIRREELYAIEYGEEALERQRPKPVSPPEPVETIELFDVKPLAGRKPTAAELYREATQ